MSAHVQQVLKSPDSAILLGENMKVGKIVLYVTGLVLLYHLSKTLALLAVVALGAWYAHKRVRPALPKFRRTRESGRDLEKRARKILSLLGKRREASFFSTPYDIRVYRSGGGDYFLVLKKFKITLFTVLKIKLRSGGEEEALGVVRLIYRTLGRARGVSFSIFLSKKDMKSAVYVLLSSSKYSAILSDELVEEMAERVDRVRGALALAVASELESTAVDGVEIARNWDIAEVVAE